MDSTLPAEPAQPSCPKCGKTTFPPVSGLVECPCHWRGTVKYFSPLPLQIQTAEVAMPEDATCLHHPRKKAVATCAGTGDYICALCAVELQGKTFSADYLSRAGKGAIGKVFQPELPRPDRMVFTLLTLSLIPGLNILSVPVAVYFFFKALRCRDADPLLRRLIDRRRIWIMGLWLGLSALVWLFSLVGLVVAVFIRK